MNCDKQELELARRVLSWSRRRISSLCPLLLPAVHALREQVLEEDGPMSTDGVRLRFWPGRVLADFRKDKDLPARRLLHITLHCLLGHLPTREERRRAPAPALSGEYARLAPEERGSMALAVFDILADRKAAYWASLLCGDDFAGGSPPYNARPPIARLYREIVSNPEIMEYLLNSGSDSALDDHELWSPRVLLCIEALPGGERDPDWGRLLGQMVLQASESCRWGDLAGQLEGEYRMEEDSAISYAQFLHRFTVPRERRLSDPDSLDFRWYHLGLELYGDTPILEPAELSEPPVPDELVIAVDTSGSCEGDVCHRFLRETVSLLRDILAGADSFRILLLQCDAQIQREFLLTSPDQISRLSEDFHPQGFGGTDFRPVFQRVEELRKNGTLPNVRGLLYLSDGAGDFPEKAPDYPVAFLIPEEEEGFCFDIPEWVTTLQLQTNDFTIKEAAL